MAGSQEQPVKTLTMRGVAPPERTRGDLEGGVWVLGTSIKMNSFKAVTAKSDTLPVIVPPETRSGT